MKQALSLLLGLSLCCGLALPADAVETGTADVRLAAVTEKVKSTLSLDSADYSSFDGELEEGAAAPVWSLRWDGDDGNLHISAMESGKILSYNYFQETGGTSASARQLDTHFPSLSRNDAWATAQSFLKQVLEPGVETALLSEDIGGGRLGEDRHNFYGDVLENGLSSPFGFRVSVDMATNSVTSFYLTGSPECYSGGIPSATPVVGAAKAGENLKSTLSLRLEYILAPDGKTASLAYLPSDSHSYYIDGQTGETVDLTALGQQVWERGTLDAAAEAGNGGAGKVEFSPAEQDGIARLDGVLDRAALDAAAQKHTTLGLSKYTLSGLYFRVDNETEVVSAMLQYARRTDDSVFYRTVTLDAKTGTVLKVYSSNQTSKADSKITDAQAQETAKSFLRGVCPTQFTKTERYELPVTATPYHDSASLSFNFAQKENGYFFPESNMTVSIDPTDGTVASYYNEFVDGVTFDSVNGLLSADAARNTWFNSYTVVLGYVSVPQTPKLSPNADTISPSTATLNTLKLGWSLERDDWYTGVDAKTGVLLESADQSDQSLSYSDLNNHWIKAKAETLATYGVGWLGGTLEPGKVLTQRDMVALLVSTSGLLYDPAGGDTATDQLYENAYSLGILTKAERADSAVLNRAETVKLLLDCTGYREVANLSNIFVCSYGDAASIPAEYYGYAALAQGLGVLDGGKDALFNALQPTTRAEAISMLFGLMNR